MWIAKTSFGCLILVIATGAAISFAAAPRAIDPQGPPPKEKNHGVRIFLDDEGLWHLNVHSDVKSTLTGTIQVVGANITGAKRVDSLEPGDYWKIDGKTNTIRLSFTTDENDRDGVHIMLSGRADKVIFDLKEDGEDKPAKIYIGRDGKTPTSGRFTLSGK